MYGPGRGMRGICGVAGLEASRGVRMGFAWYLWGMGGECVVFAGWPAYGGRAFAEASRGVRVGSAWYLRGTGGVWAGNAWYLRGGRLYEKNERSRRRRAGFAWHLRGMGGECVVFAGWPGFVWGSRGICGVRVVYGRGMRGICEVAGLRATSVRGEGSRGVRVKFAGYGRCIWAGNAWYLQRGRPTGDERSRRRRVRFAWNLRGASYTETICAEVSLSSPP